MSKFPKLILALSLIHLTFANECEPCREPSNEPCQEMPKKQKKRCPKVCFERGYPTNPTCTPSAYSEPARYELTPTPWDFWFDVGFTYWIAEQEGLDLAISTSIQATNSIPVLNGQYVFQKNDYQPGFKVGLGLEFGYDNWLGFADYAWFRMSTTTLSGTPPGDPLGAGARGVWDLRNWALGQTNTLASDFRSKWYLNLDIVDGGIKRPYYQGASLIVSTFGGLRGQWIRQHLRIRVTPASAQFPANASQIAIFENRSYSWGVGPRMGVGTEWHLGAGFRLQGDFAGSLIYTRYDKVETRADSTLGSRQFPRYAIYRDLDVLRVGNDMNMGLGWGTYFDCRSYHFDLLATYDFQVFWNQNMMRQLADDVTDGVSTSANNLYLHGLTIKAQFDF